jgi:hypothetical protein
VLKNKAICEQRLSVDRISAHKEYMLKIKSFVNREYLHTETICGQSICEQKHCAKNKAICEQRLSADRVSTHREYMLKIKSSADRGCLWTETLC